MGKDEEVNGQGGKRGAPAPLGATGTGDGSWDSQQWVELSAVVVVLYILLYGNCDEKPSKR